MTREEIEAAADRDMERLRRRLGKLAAEHGVDPPAEAELTLWGLLRYLLELGVDPARFLPAAFRDEEEADPGAPTTFATFETG